MKSERCARMMLSSDVGTRNLARVMLTAIFGLIANQAMAQTIQGTATYRERMALPAGAVFDAAIEDVSRADAPATVIASTRVASPGNPPIKFAITYDPAKIVADHRYVVRAKILLDGKLLFTSDTATPVINKGSPTTVLMTLRRAGAGQTSPANPGAPTPGANRPLGGTYWRAVELAGKPTPSQNATREVHLVFQAADRVSGSDGCNRITGSYERKGDGITFGLMAGTQMACADNADIEQGFRAALKGASRLRIAGDRLELLDATGSRLAAFEGRAQTPSPAASPKLEGTAWQLVKFQGSDDTTLTPDDKTKYTIEFGAGGQLTARIDCNRGRGTWKSKGANQLEFGPLTLTRAKCPPGSLHDRIVKHWPYIRSFVIKEGHLFLALMADGGTYEFEPFPGKQHQELPAARTGL
jgi:putative lipoprotein